MTAFAISEPRSVKRGRPVHPLIARLGPIVRAYCDEIRTVRGVADRCFALHAIGILSEIHDTGDTSFAYLVDPPEVMAGRQLLVYGALAELGRLAYDSGPVVMLEVAAWICARELSPGAAERFVRAQRALYPRAVAR